MTTAQARLSTRLAHLYRLERELGTGGMATVYLARDLKHDRDVAIKVLHPELAAALGGDRFLSEIKTTARLQHPHILPLLDSGDADNLLYYVMPYVTGETLRARLVRERQLPIDDVLRITREVADALGSAHALGIIHRDIKPENILLQGGHALVADFGIALAVQSAGGARMTQTGLSLGTPQYMSPEQAMGEKSIDLRSDLYALGAVAYEMLVGEPPFTGPSMQAIVARVMTEQPRGIAIQRKAVPPGVEAVVLRALEKIPADRYSSAAEFLAGLAAPAGGALVGRRTPSRTLGLLLVAAATAAIGIAGGWLLGRRAPGDAKTVAWSTSIALPDSLALEPLISNTEGMPTIALSPDGSQVAFISRRGSSSQLFIRSLADFSIRALDGTEGALAPFFSPDGAAIGFFTLPAGDAAGIYGTRGQVKRVALADGRVTTVGPSIVEPWGGAWAPDGRLLVSKERGLQLVEFAPEGDSLRAVSCRGSCTFPEFLPDGVHVIVSTFGGGLLDVIDLERGTVNPLLRAGASSALDRVRGMSARYDGDGHLVYVGPGGQVLSVPFDASRVQVTGVPVQLIEGVRVESGRGGAQFALSRAGVLVYAPGPVMSVGILVRSDRNGKLDTLAAPAANYNSLELAPDGKQVVTRISTNGGDGSIQVVDAETGKVTPWITGPWLSRPSWAPDGRRVVFSRMQGKDAGVFIGDPGLSAPPERLPLPPEFGFPPIPMADGVSYRRWAGDTLVIARADGAPPRRVIARDSPGATSDDDRWYVAEETQPGSSSIVARSLDGSGRRTVVVGEGQFGMVAWAAGGHEFITADDQRRRDKLDASHTMQGFYAMSYDPAASEPIGTPRLLFRAEVADFPGRNYAVGMAGNRFVFKQHVTTPPAHEIRVMRDWHQRLSQRSRP